MNKNISVDCTISRSGRVWIKRVKLDEEWLVVEQGRQWHDENGRHVLIMSPDGQVDEILLSAASMCWEMKPRSSNPQIV